MKKSLLWKIVDKLATVPVWGWILSVVVFLWAVGISQPQDHEFKEYMGEAWYWDDGPSNRWSD